MFALSAMGSDLSPVCVGGGGVAMLQPDAHIHTSTSVDAVADQDTGAVVFKARDTGHCC